MYTLSYPYTSFLLQNLKNQWLCSSATALLASVSVQPQTQWLWRTKRSCRPNCDCIMLLVATAQRARTGTLLTPARGKARSFAMSHQRQDVPVLRVHPDCSSRGCLMDSVYSSPRLKHSLLQQAWDTSSREWGSTFSSERDSTSSREWGSTPPLVVSGPLFPSAPHAWPQPGQLSLSLSTSRGGAACRTQSQPCSKEPHCSLSLCWVLSPSDLSQNWLKKREKLPWIQRDWDKIPDPRQVLLQRSLESRI